MAMQLGLLRGSASVLARGMASSGPASLVLRRGPASVDRASLLRHASSDTKSEESKSPFPKFLSPESAVGTASTNRWGMFAPAFATHVCLGAPYGWSAISSQLARESGIVASSSADWALDMCTYPMSVMVRVIWYCLVYSSSICTFPSFRSPLAESLPPFSASGP